MRDPVARHLYYVQFKQMVLDAVWDIHHDIAADMACRITLSSFGRYEEEVRSSLACPRLAWPCWRRVCLALLPVVITRPLALFAKF